MNKNRNKVALKLSDMGEFLAKYTENSDNSSAYWISSPDFKKIQFISPTYEVIWGRPRDELYQNPPIWITYLHPDDVPNEHPLEAMTKEILKLGEKARYARNYRIIRPDGEVRWIMDRGFPLYDESGACYGVTGIATDITDQKKYEEELRRAKESAESANQAKDIFIQNMSHDIRTPLSGIVGMSKLLEENAVSDQERQYARWVNESGNLLLELLNGVLDVISADNIKESDLHHECFDLYATIDSIGRLELPAMQAKHIEFRVQIDEQIPRYVISDKTKLHRILLNLLGNAIKFTETGYILIHVKYLGRKNDEVQLEINVEDTGIGIPTEVQANIFDRFFRVNPSYKGIYRGHGLGLHIAQQYVSLLNGEIKLISEVGKGTRFYFTLWLKTGESSLLKKENAELPHPENKIALTEQSEMGMVIKKSDKAGSERPHFLLIEDNAIALRLLETLCTQHNCDFTSAIDGEKALELAKSKSFDLIISDIGLPGMSGIELAHAIREDEKHHNKQNIPIIGLTAHVMAEATKPGLQAGMNKVLQKPIRNHMLEQLIEQYISFTPRPNEPLPIKPASGLGLDLPETEKQLFELQDYPLLDIEQGIMNLGNIETLKELLKDMLNLLPADVIELEKAFAAQNWGLVEKIAHKIKGGAVYCGTVKMKYACQYMERYHRAGHRGLLDDLYRQLIQVMLDTKHSISEWLK